MPFGSNQFMISRVLASLVLSPTSQKVMTRHGTLVRSVSQLWYAARQTRTAHLRRFAQLAFVALSVVLAPVAAYANGNMVDSFTYNGSQPGFTPGSVYTVSIAGQELSVCLLTPNPTTTAPNLQYSSNCITNAAQNDTNSYTSVAFIGSSSQTPNFAVGDGAGNIYVMQIQFNSGNPNPISLSTIGTSTLMDPDDNSRPCGAITSLAVDPDSSYLYIGCVGEPANSLAWRFARNEYLGGFLKVSLAAWQITNSGYISNPGFANYGNTVPFGYGNPDYYWVTYGSSTAPASLASAATFQAPGTDGFPSAVNPKMRVYPPYYPGLAGTSYYSTGGVFYSGIVSGLSGNTPINSAFMCSGGWCLPAYNIALPESSNGYTGGAVFTAAELGANGAGTPVLYWNQLQAITVDVPNGSIPITNTNLVTACQLNSVISTAVTSSPCSTQNNVSWPPAGVPSSTMWLDQLVFSPTPSAVANNTSFTQGLLQISAWNNGYLAYYDVATGSYVPGLFFSNNGNGGEVGANVQGLTTDSNGNLLIQAGASGLLGFNPFPNTANNIQTQQDTTYIPIPADSTASNSCNGICEVIQGLGLISSVVTIITAADLDDDEGSHRTQFAHQIPELGDLLQSARGMALPSRKEPDAFRADATEFEGSFRIAMSFDGGASGNLLGSVQSDMQPSLFGLAAFAAAAPEAEAQCCDTNGDAPNPVLANFLGQKPYWGKFTYSEQQMGLMGIRPGDTIKGIQFRLGEGISPQPKQPLRFKRLQIGMYSDGTTRAGGTPSRYGSIVVKRSLSVRRCSYNRDVADGYGPMISFGRPYRYLGGDLTFELRHSGSQNSKRFYLDAFGGAGVSGAYAQLASVWSAPTDVTTLKVAPQIRLIKRGTTPGRRPAPRCN